MIGIRTALEIYNKATPEGVNEFREEWMLKYQVRPHVSGKSAMAYISDNRWVLDCPECNGGIAFLWSEEAVACLNCGAVIKIELPGAAEIVRAEKALLRRMPGNRHWFPHRGEKARDLERENRGHRYELIDGGIE